MRDTIRGESATRHLSAQQPLHTLPALQDACVRHASCLDASETGQMCLANAAAQSICQCVQPHTSGNTAQPALGKEPLVLLVPGCKGNVLPELFG